MICTLFTGEKKTLSLASEPQLVGGKDKRGRKQAVLPTSHSRGKQTLTCGKWALLGLHHFISGTQMCVIMLFW